MRGRYDIPVRRQCVSCGRDYLAVGVRQRCCTSECRKAAARASWRAYSSRNRSKRAASKAKIYDKKADEIIDRTIKRRAEAGADVKRDRGRRIRALHPDRAAARGAVYHALKNGRLTKSSCRCGRVDVEAHHDDYSKPLEVVWLCRPCHLSVHGRKPRKRTIRMMEEKKQTEDGIF